MGTTSIAEHMERYCRLPRSSYGDLAVEILRAAATRVPELVVEARADSCRFRSQEGEGVLPGCSGTHLLAALDAISDQPSPMLGGKARSTKVTHRLSDLGKTALLDFREERDGYQELRIGFEDKRQPALPGALWVGAVCLPEGTPLALVQDLVNATIGAADHPHSPTAAQALEAAKRAALRQQERGR